MRRNQRERRGPEIRSPRASETERPCGMKDSQEREGKAELLRRKAEARLKTEDAARKQRTEQAQQKAEAAAQKERRAKAEFDRQDVINGLSALVSSDNLKRHRKMDVDEERYYATKVLLSMVRKNDAHLRRLADEAERKQKIEEILALVKEYNDK